MGVVDSFFFWFWFWAGGFLSALLLLLMVRLLISRGVNNLKGASDKEKEGKRLEDYGEERG